MQYAIPFLLVVAGLALGWLVTWFLERGRLSQAAEAARAETAAERATLTERLRNQDQQLAELRNRADQQQAELASSRENLQSEAARRAAAEQLNARLPELEARLEAKEQAGQASQQTIADLRARLAEATVELENERKAAAEKLALLQEAQLRLGDAFKVMSSEALKSNNQVFLELAKTTLERYQESSRGDLDKRQQAIHEMVKPVRESLDKFDTKVQELENVRTGAYVALTEQVRSLLDMQNGLRTETANLVKALRAPVVRGRWGEIQLKRVVEMAGMVDHCDFFEQRSVETETGRLRPDLLVHLPGAKHIVIDAKAPLEAYLAAIEASDDAVRVARLIDHARQIRAHLTALGRKAYWDQFQPAPEFVVLFLPGESFFSAALEHDPALIEAGVQEHVILATPTTLIALLRAVAYGWRQENLALNAQAISDLGRELYKRLADLAGHLGRVGKSLGNAVENYNKAVGTLENRVLSSARKFKELEASPAGLIIEEVLPIDQAPRLLQATELLSLLDEHPPAPPANISEAPPAATGSG